MNKVTINGVTITASGNISIINGRITVNGQDVTPDAKQITIQVTGDVPSLSVDYCQSLTVGGNVTTLRSGSGDVTVNGGAGSVQTASGDVDCGEVGGDVSTASGDVSCGAVSGSVRAVSGDIKHKRS